MTDYEFSTRAREPLNKYSISLGSRRVEDQGGVPHQYLDIGRSTNEEIQLFWKPLRAQPEARSCKGAALSLQPLLGTMAISCALQL